MTDTMPEQTESWDDAQPAPSGGATYPEAAANPHNHRFTISMDGRGPMIVARGNTATEINAAFQELQDAGVTTLLASVYSHLKAEMAVASGLGPVSPVPAAPPGPPAPPQGGYAPAPAPGGPPFGPNVSVPAAPGYQGPPAPQAPPAPQGQWGGQQQGGNRAEPKPRPADWPQVYRISLARGDKSFKDYRAANQQYFKGKVSWAGGGDYWIHGDVVQSVAGWNPIPA